MVWMLKVLCEKNHVFIVNKRIMFQMMFFTMLFMYSAFVLTSIGDQYYKRDIAKVFEYYVYFWGAGDLIEELISCFVSQNKSSYI